MQANRVIGDCSGLHKSMRKWTVVWGAGGRQQQDEGAKGGEVSEIVGRPGWGGDGGWDWFCPTSNYQSTTSQKRSVGRKSTFKMG